MLELLGIQLLQGPEREAWQRTAQEAANAIAGTGNQWLGDPADLEIRGFLKMRDAWGSPKTVEKTNLDVWGVPPMTQETSKWQCVKTLYPYQNSW